MAIYAQRFRRFNHHVTPALEEHVVVIFETFVPYENETLEEFEAIKWASLWEQYPSWVCPFHQSNPPPNALEAFRHGYSSALPSGPTQKLS